MAQDLAELVVLGKYRLIRRLATGGMAEIHLAVQQGPHGFEKVVVVKVILAEVSTNDDLVQMFLDEARIAANLEHDNVVRVYDFGEIGGRYYLAMEHLPGEDLLSIFQMLRRAHQWLPLGLACDIVRGAAAGLHYAHEQRDGRGRPLNIVHRDVTPSNIIVTYHGAVKLLDFGIARAESNITKTAAGVFKGKVGYVSPEQALGDPVDRRSDVFSLGVVLFEALTMARPFSRDSERATLRAVISDAVPPPSSLRPEVPAELDAIVQKAMCKDVAGRYQTAAELGADLERVASGYDSPRGPRALAELLDGLFEEERRLGKLHVSQLENLAAVRGPSPPPTPDLPLLTPSLPRAALSSDETRAGAPPASLLGRGLLLGVALVAAAVGGAAFVAWSRPEPASPASASPGPASPGPASSASTVKPAPGSAPPPVAAPIAPEPMPVPREPEHSATGAPLRTGEDGRMRAPRGKLTLDTAPWSEVFLKGRKLGDTPLVDYPLASGVHNLALVNEGRGLRQVIEVEVEPGKTTVLRLKL